jgi:hypothetical protein
LVALIGNSTLSKYFNKTFLWKLSFIFSTIFVVIYVNLHYNIARSPDFEYYSSYLLYFFGESEITTREQGLIYFFLVSFFTKILLFDFGLHGYELVINNGVLFTNCFLYLIGLFGLYKLLKLKKYKAQEIFFAFTVMNFFPQTINMLLTMKPEIIVFSFLPWSLYCIYSFIEKKEFSFLYLALFPNLIIFSSKMSMLAGVGLIYFFILVRHWKKFNNKQVRNFIILGLLIYPLIYFENFIYNGRHIFDHPSRVEYNDILDLQFLVNINLNQLITNPFRNIHANSFLGIIMLDTFGDYFQTYAYHDNSLFTFSSGSLSRFWIISYWPQFLSIVLTLFFYFYIFFIGNKDKENNLFYKLPFIGFSVLIISSLGFPEPNFNANLGDTFKGHYYSYLIVITFAFVVVSIAKKYKKLKIYILIIFIFLFGNLYGFVKEDVDSYQRALNLRNSYSTTCSFNALLVRSLDSKNCNSNLIRICKFDNLLINKNNFTNELNSYFEIDEYLPQQTLKKESSSIVPRSTKECFSYVGEMYRYEHFLQNKLVIPKINLLYYVIAIFSMLRVLFKNNYLFNSKKT